MFAPDDQEFSLDAEIEAEVPADLPGKMPTSLRDLYPVKSSSSPASTTTAAASRSAPTAKASLEEAPAAKQASSSGKLKTLEGSKMPFKPGPGREQRLTGRIQASGKPLNKATWIEAMTDYELPSFPLHAELLARVPPDLPGKMPESALELVEMLLASSATPASQPPSPNRENR